MVRIVDSLLRDNYHGLLLQGGNSADTLTSAAIGESTVAGGSLGIKAESSVASARVRVDVTESSISHNTVGVAVAGSVGSTVLTLNGSMVTANGSGLQQSGSATLKTLGNNSVSGNGGADVSGTLTPFSPIPNNPPGIALTSPLPNQSFTAPASIVLTANASDADGNLARVEFYNGTSLLGSVSAAPYSHTWSDVPPGSYTLTARAIDSLGAQAVSVPLGITVSNPPTGVYYLHADHLNTPRMVTDAANQVVWRHLPTTEPFGSSAPEEDPDNDGNPFTLNLRFPGQYFDRETNLHYNYFRDYDSSTGRYVQSDPIGLRGGINTYSYVRGNPLRYIDPLGLDPGDLFATSDDAAVDAANYARRQPIKNVEYGGWIYPVGKCWTYNFITGTQTNLPSKKLKNAMPSNRSGIWHTHPAIPGPYNPNSFSDDDMQTADDFGIPIYLNTPQNVNKVYDPQDPANPYGRDLPPYRKPKSCECE